MTDKASMVRAQNDLYMVVNNHGAEINAMHDNTEEAVDRGDLTIAELQRSAMNILRFLLVSPVSSRPVKIPKVKDIAALAEGDLCGQEVTLVATNRNDLSGCDSLMVRVEEDGCYAIHVSILSGASYLAQLLCQLLFNGEVIADVQTNGTGRNKLLQRVTKVNLHAGVYEITFNHIRPGIEFDYIEFIKLS